MKTHPNAPIYSDFTSVTDPDYKKGLTKREYFAAIAMQGLCADPTFTEDYDTITISAVKFADKLIEKLNLQEK